MKLTLTQMGIGICIFVIGGALGAWLMTLSEETPVFSISPDVRDKVVDSRFTNPLLECAEIPESLSIGGVSTLRSEIEDLVEERTDTGQISTAGIYFRDLNNGPWFGVNEEASFYPASLLKIPLAMWYYWRADTDPELLDQEIEFTGPKGTSIVHFPPKKSLEVGKTYSIDQLIEYMLQESDNDAANILNQFTSPEETERVYTELGVPVGSLTGPYEIHVRAYSAFFRVLYNATYLGRSLSEHLLSVMSNSSFKDGIVAGVPQDVAVSHKFGEKLLSPDGSKVQLHDCGIVYARSPYILCIMTQGEDMDELASFISEVSSRVYQSVE